jgi:4-alpha-glucanotransferase
MQLNPTSLPGGRLGEEAYRFIDWLADAGQSWWQVLPLGPAGEGDSPYKSPSAFAGAPELLAEPRAAVGPRELAAFRERQRYWIGDWESYAGDGAAADQLRFEREWGALRAYAAERGIRVIGDVPIYVAPAGADHLAHPELFRDGEVAGAPPDKFSDTGQLWGNPLYDWGALRRRDYRWWTERFRRISELVDVARIDHFRGFVAYWAVPAGADDARSGRWKRGPGRAVFDAAERALGTPLSLVAEDLGVITPAVDRLRDSLGLPGTRVLQFGFDPDEPRSPHRPEQHVENSVVYTGTHDHDTARGWYESLGTESRSLFDAEIERRALRTGEPWWGLIRLALSSPARLAMVQAQDVLGLGSDARMNTPGRPVGSWRWKLRPGALTAGLAARLREATDEARRLR